MAKPPRTKPPRRATKPTGGRWRRIALAVGLLLTLALSLYVAYLDGRVRSEFAGKRWALPARVYARPLEIYAGLSLGREELVAHLRTLGYRKVADLQGPGSYRELGRSLELVTRAFPFWDGLEPSRTVRVSFQGRRVGDLAAAGAPGVIRLDPALIAGIYPAHYEDRVLVRREEIPQQLVAALISVEDRKFYQHHGMDPKAILRAFLANLRAGHTVQGGSTLTQQLVKNFFLTNERTLQRKLKELVMALLVEWRYDKDEILEAYANEVYLGQDGQRAIHGFGLASHFYFGRPLNELAVDQVALLVGLVRGPSYYDPRRHPERARARRNLVLAMMAEVGVLEAEAAYAAAERPLGLTPQDRRGITRYPAFLDLVRRQLRRDYRDEDLTSEGLHVFTTVDLQVQSSVEQAVAGGLPILERRHGLPAGSLQGAAIFTDPGTGEVLGLVGGSEPRAEGFNRALDARRPIGSLVKPFVYMSALAQPQRYNLMSILQDEPLTVPNPNGAAWTPRNYDQQFHGPVPLRTALANSYNAATVRLGLELGLEQVVDSLHRYGVERDVPAYPSLLLGALELAPIEVAELYQVLANGGFRAPLRAIREVMAADGEPLQRYPLQVESVASPASVYLTTAALQAAVASGTGRSLSQKLAPELQLAGKTGTTDGGRDSWFAGYSGNMLGVVWLGRDDNEATEMSGAQGALRIFGDAMRGLPVTALQPLPATDIEWRWVDPGTGVLADAACPGAERLPFVSGAPLPPDGPCARIAQPQPPRESSPSPLEAAEAWFRRIFR